MVEEEDDAAAAGRMELEICVDTFASAQAAFQGGKCIRSEEALTLDQKRI